MTDKKENVQLEKTMDKAEQEKLESVKKSRCSGQNHAGFYQSGGFV